MRWKTTLTHTTIAAALVGAVAAAPLIGTSDAEALSARDRFAEVGNVDRPVVDRRGPLFGLRVNSFNVAGDAKVLGCFRYRCPPFEADGTRERYHVVRSVHFDRDVKLNDCDEVLAQAFGGRDVRFSALVRTTRWIRNRGPNGVTPIGGFVARMDLNATFSAGPDGTFTFGMLDFGLIGTQGLRPNFGDPDLATDPLDFSRCNAPFHDEGYYQGHVDRRGVKKLIRAFGADNLVVRRLRRLNASIIAGTFEGRTVIDAVDEANRYNFCKLARVGWWFDGLVGFSCRRDLPEPLEPDPEPIDPTPVDTKPAQPETDALPSLDRKPVR